MNSEISKCPVSPDLSVVVPYFNQPEQLEIALADLQDQKNISLEVFVVDDASEKECGAIVEKFRQSGLNVTLLRQKNRSYTLAGRLLGMKNAHGRWLAFMDADDRLNSETAYAEALRAADAADTDILHFRVQAVDNAGFISHWPYAAPFYNGRLEGREIFAEWLKNSCPAHSVWNKLYSRPLYMKVKDLAHDLLIYRIEDFYLSAHFIFFAESYTSCDLLVYKYFLPGGDHLAKSAGRAFDAIRMFLSFPERFQKFGLDKELCRKFKDYLGILVTINGGRMCRFLPDNIWKNMPFELDFSSEGMKKVLQYGSRRELFFILAIANASNARKLGDLHRIINN